MNTDALLSLIADLYASLATANARIKELETVKET